MNIVVSRDEFGEQKITKVKVDGETLTSDRIKDIQNMSFITAGKELKLTRDKLIWFRH